MMEQGLPQMNGQAVFKRVAFPQVIREILSDNG